jgi:hypothetical protein
VRHQRGSITTTKITSLRVARRPHPWPRARELREVQRRAGHDSIRRRSAMSSMAAIEVPLLQVNASPRRQLDGV